MSGTGRPKFETIVTQVAHADQAHAHGQHGYGHGHHGHVSHSLFGHHGAHDHGNGHHGHESYELSLLHDHHSPGNARSKSRAGTPDPIVDTLTYRTSTRVVAVIDIVYSMIMLIFQLGILIGGSSYRHGAEEAQDEEDEAMRKMNLTIGVLIWMGMFAVCIVQLLVAGALYGGTNERDARKTLRNCRIWCFFSIFLALLLTVELVGIIASNEIGAFVFPLLVFCTELVFRMAGLVIISRFIKELAFEISDLADSDKEVHYMQLPPPTSSPSAGGTGTGAGGVSPVHSIASKNTEYEYLFQKSAGLGAPEEPHTAHRSHGHSQRHPHPN